MGVDWSVGLYPNVWGNRMVAHVSNPILLPVKLTDGQQDCVDKLKEALEEAERGNVHTVGVIVCMSKGYGAVIGGTNAAELNLGLDSLKRKILDSLEKPKPVFKL